MGAQTITTRLDSTTLGNPKKYPTTNNHNASRKIRQSKTPRGCSSQAKHFVEHDYHDHLYDPIIRDMTPPDKNGVQKRARVHRGGVSQPFPEKLHYMLSRVESEGLSDIVSWQPHGRCFIVRKPKEFVTEIMPRFFKQTKLTSFQRQLNLYGFSRLTAGVDRGGYYHELFIRGRMDLCAKMTRTRVKGNGSKGASSPETEPNFYSMTPCSESKPSESYPSVLSDDSKTENSDDRVAFIPDEDSEDGIIGFPLEIQIPMARLSPLVADDTLKRSLDSAPPSESTSTSVPVISPLLESRRMVSPTSFLDLVGYSTISCEGSLPDIHSGDKLHFEGLPFHYLETKDVEDSLLLEVI